MSHDGHLVVNFARLQETSNHIQSTIGAMQSQLAELERAAAPLVAGWDGEAKQAYLDRQQLWRRASEDLVAVLGGIRRALDESVADYASAEARNTNLFR